MEHNDNRMLIMLGDGMSGRDVPSLGGRTTIEAANTPALDTVARLGASALMYVAGPGQPIGSDTSHMALLGYDPFAYYRGRGPLEARGVGIELQPGDVAFRCNFATIDERTRNVIDRRAGRPQFSTQPLCEAVAAACREEIDEAEVIFEASVEHRAALVLRGEGLDYRVTDVDPHEEGVPPAECRPVDGLSPEDEKRARKTAEIVNKFVAVAERVLPDHEINVKLREEGKPIINTVLPRGAGEAVALPPFSQTHEGLRGAMVVEVDLIRGLAAYADMDLIDVPGATGKRDTDELAIAAAVAESLERYDIILCNIKAPDLGGHDRDPEQKIEAIEKVDRAVGYLLDTLDWSRVVMMIGADHCTPVTVGNHTGDAVPVAFHGVGVRRDLVERYSEREAACGGVGQILGCDVLTVLRNFAGRIEKFGA